MCVRALAFLAMAVYIPVARGTDLRVAAATALALAAFGYGVGLAIPKTKKTSTKGKYVPRNV